jgi:hypothetical protein
LLFAWIPGCARQGERASTRLQATDAPRDIVERAVQALGGADKLARWSTGRVYYRPGLEQVAAQGADVVFDDLFQLPGHFKRIMRVRKGGMDSITVWVINNGKGWQRRGDAEATDFSSDLSNTAQHQIADLFNVAPLLEEGVKLSVVGDEKLDGQPAIVVRAESENLGQVEYAFDAESALPVRCCKRARHPATEQEADMVTYLKDYRNVDGGKVPFRLVGQADGKPMMDMQILEVRFARQYPPGEFSKP